MAEEGHFRVDLIWIARQQIDYLAHKAIMLGVGPMFAGSLRAITDRLQTSPLTWGEYLKYLHALKMAEFHVIHDRLSIRYSVDIGNRMVWIRRVIPLSNHPCCVGS